jgi:GNAT superfamily N-acetyltransferase
VTLRIEQVHDDEGARRWHALDTRALPHDHPGLESEPLQKVQYLASGQFRSERCLLVLATDDGTDVGNASMWLPTRDNVENATIIFAIDPSQRGRGCGTAFADALVELARTEGRRNLVGFVGRPFEGPENLPGTHVAERLGAKVVLEVARRMLDLDEVRESELDEVLRDDDVAAHSADYDLVTWVDRVPDSLADGAARLLGRMSTDVPMGELTWEAEVWDAARYREKEDEALALGRTRIAAGAVERSSGELVAYTDVGVMRDAPTVAHQWDTIVDPPHRGHRLGVLIKVANLRLLKEISPQSRRLCTFNALSNDHMVAINDRLGFRAVERSAHWELKI